MRDLELYRRKPRSLGRVDDDRRPFACGDLTAASHASPQPTGPQATYAHVQACRSSFRRWQTLQGVEAVGVESRDARPATCEGYRTLSPADPAGVAG